MRLIRTPPKEKKMMRFCILIIIHIYERQALAGSSPCGDENLSNRDYTKNMQSSFLAPPLQNFENLSKSILPGQNFGPLPSKLK